MLDQTATPIRCLLLVACGLNRLAVSGRQPSIEPLGALPSDPWQQFSADLLMSVAADTQQWVEVINAGMLRDLLALIVGVVLGVAWARFTTGPAGEAESHDPDETTGS